MTQFRHELALAFARHPQEAIDLLRRQADRYRQLAGIVFDAYTSTIASDCACELETELRLLEVKPLH